MKSIITMVALLTIPTFSHAGIYDKHFNCETKELISQQITGSEKFELNITFPENFMKGTVEVIYTSDQGVASSTLLTRIPNNKFRMAGIMFAKKRNPHAHGIQGSSWNVIMLENTALLTIQATGEQYFIYKCNSTEQHQ